MSNTIGKSMAALACGIAVGAVLGILFAPSKGTVTRRKIARKAQNVSHAMQNKIEDLKDSVNDLIEEIEDVAEEKLQKMHFGK